MAPPSLLYEALCTLVFNFALTGVNAAAALLKPHLPGAAELDDIALVFALVMGFLTLFAFLLAGAYINPAATAIEFLAGNIKPRRFLALLATEMVATVAAVAAVAELLRFYPVPGVQPPTPPNTGADAAVIAASEFAIAASTFLAGGFAARLGPILAPFASSAFYVAAACYERGQYSGAIINPAAIVALHVYRQDLTAVATWRAAAVPAAPYLVGIAGAVALLGAVRRASAPRRAGRVKAD